MKKGLSYLIESELEKAEIILAARSITDEIQKMAETVAKMDAEDVMPLTDPIRDMFGQEVAKSFSDTVSQHLRDLADKIKETKNVIGDAIAQMESGQSVSNDLTDMGDDVPAEPAAPESDVAAPPQDGEDDFNPFGDAADTGEAPAMGEEGDDAFDSKAAGRARKESYEAKKPMLESKIVKQYSRLIREGKTANDAANLVARKNKVSVQKVIESVEEAFNVKKDYANAVSTAKKQNEEVTNADRALVQEFSSLVREGLTPVNAASKIAENYGIDYTDIVDIISGFAK